ncbi:MAG TPA: molecular chaperone HtpG, partial [Alphaproteobacteria bacterium]
MTEEKLAFTADVSRLLDIVAHALYSNRDVFLRELISNAADACDRLRYEAVRDPKLAGNGAFSIRVAKDAPKRILTVQDNGIGMNRAELVENLGTIAKSGTAALMEQIKSSGNEKEKLSLIGQFGVGFYASFMVSKRVEVISRKAGDTQAWRWESDGRTGFSIREAVGDEAKILEGGSGTAVIVHIDDESSEFLLDEKLKQVIQTWSDHIAFPVYLGDDAETPVNRAAALWTRPKNEITEEQYDEFYRHIGHGLDEPLTISHWKAEGKIEYTALLFTPTLRPWDLYDPTRKNTLRLYVKRVFITDDCEGLVFPWLRFLRGVIDSEDLPLNISREMLQHNPVITKIRGSVAKRVLGDLDKLSRDDADAFATFWGQFGSVLKEGLYDAYEHRDDIFRITRFYSTHKPDELTSLDNYVSRMKDGQDAIYYISGENIETLKNSPQIEGFKARGLEVLFFTDTIDDFWLQSVPEFGGKPFKSVTKGNIDLTKFASTNGDARQDTEKPTTEISERLMTIIRKELEDEIGDVRVTNRLTDSPVCLVAAEHEIDLRMERVLRIHQKFEAPAKRVLEINPGHALIRRLSALADANADKKTMGDAAHLLLDQARIIQG